MVVGLRRKRESISAISLEEPSTLSRILLESLFGFGATQIHALLSQNGDMEDLAMLGAPDSTASKQAGCARV
jgi:hypothetical protein